MALERAIVTRGLLDELELFATLIRPLSEDEWSAATRCGEWSTGDVARHVVGTMADVVALRLDGLGTPEMTQRAVDERAGRSAAELADECATVTVSAAAMLPGFDDAAWAAPIPDGPEGTLGDGVEALWYDTWLHGDDIRDALGLPNGDTAGLAGAVSHVGTLLAQRGWGGEAPDPKDLEDPDKSQAARVFVLTATGRHDGGSLTERPPNIYA